MLSVFIKRFVFVVAISFFAHVKAGDLTGVKAKNLMFPSSDIVTAGQPVADDFALLKSAGIKTIINMRTDKESIDFDEKALVESLGLKYVSLPIAGASGVSKENAMLLHRVLTANEGKTLIHCASGNRVGALLALRGFYAQNLSTEEALVLGKKAGLTRLESKVVEQLRQESLVDKPQ
ncbi:beta-lactamase hydrolase domain-containing protein [Pleionea sp. CnH1-48]|uniref:beta-lactamase hydrolase domain-containing protein n=1 Tax=Pleionea sp. CnH1-48 TaxID=2954494 RepID=UPI0020986043|nr:sulfur transferase domain-containing protein [Pleionea sp. CnH1-48]MCO7224901.1 sulfur transferase domain-containing protein [Pleionea sp. CnH1-48]